MASLFPKQHRFALDPLPHGQGSLRLILAGATSSEGHCHRGV
jgi:hypothetical protein